MKTFVINLDRSVERMEIMTAQLQRLNIDYERVSAIDGKTLSINNTHGYDGDLNKKLYHKPLNSGEIACVLSHRKAWQALIDSGEKAGLILEDDAKLHSSAQTLAKKLERCSEKWDVIKLYSGKKPKRIISSTPITENFYLSKTNKIPSSNLAQFITNEAAQSLLDMSSKFGEPADVLMKRWWHYNLQIYSITPNLAETTQVESEINCFGNRNNIRYSKFRKLAQQVAYSISNFVHTKKLPNPPEI